jgi:hypothetical protein
VTWHSEQFVDPKNLSVYTHNEVYPLLNLASRVYNALHSIGQGTNLSEISQRPKPVKSIRQVWELGQVLLEII